MTREPSLRVAIYARYSSDLQSDRSVDDQIRDCRAYILHQGWKEVIVCQDKATSGATLFRPGIQKLLKAASDKQIDIVIAEALDRISRNLGDTANLHDQLKFHRVRIVTLSESNVTPMHVAFKGLMNGQFLEDLTLKIRRGQRGSIAMGLSAGGLSYGYEVVRELDLKGEFIRGKRQPREDQAKIIRRIFAEYTSGMSPYEIARRLNHEKIPSARGGAWGVSSIVGHRQRKVGILHNELYVGRLIYNRLTMVKDPSTGKRISRENPESAWVIMDVPELRIVDQKTWDIAQVLKNRHGGKGKKMARHARRPRHLLSGLVACPVCDGNMIGAGANHLICSNAHSKGTCSSSRKVNRELLEMRVVEYLQGLLAHPDAVAAYVTSYHEAVARDRRTSALDERTKAKELTDTVSKIARLVTAIENGAAGDVKQVMARIAELESRRVELEAAQSLEPDRTVTLHPNAHTVYAARIKNLKADLSKDAPTRLAASQTLRGLIDKIIVHPPTGPGRVPEVELRGRLAEFLGLTAPMRQNKTGTNEWVYLVAREGFEPPTNGL